MRGCQEGIRINTLLPGVQGAERPGADKKYRLLGVCGIITNNALLLIQSSQKLAPCGRDRCGARIDVHAVALIKYLEQMRHPRQAQPVLP